ncbi:PaaI family thioesterase [Terricaulis silvestris]|uniref:Acyl-coenzyme A thioesterase PaaI n=1 Tax=Terricaulis silvestris TaxID=2686094 RepID=A0A6I6MSL1_9CAUL|nr:PaaI family thioesterase [Terricaulis silvestris]QGZ95564.1 Acyl-coenzyme A thioesterase PaaI [Terricaulis silvestris]
MTDAAPDGFELFTRPSPLMDPWRPLYARTEADRIILGVHLSEPHTNSRATAHGGLIAALADQAMGMSCGVKLKVEQVKVVNLWTTSLAIDYLGAAKVGQWLTFDTTFVRAGKTICYAECDVSADGETVARGRASFRVALAS